VTRAKPRPYQDLIRDFGIDRLFASRGRCRMNVFASPGTGKTMASYMLFDQLRDLGAARRAIVFAPKRVALTTWPDEREKWLESFGHLRVAAAIGTAEERLAALHSRPDILTINYDNIEWLVETLGDSWDFDTVFPDEASRLKGMRVSLQTSSLGKEFINGQGSKRAKLLAKVAHKKVANWINLTGSPAPNGLQDVWALQWFIDGGESLGRSFTDFEHRYFYRDYTGNKLIPHDWAQKRIEDALRPTTITIDARDWFDIKEPIETVIRVDLPPKARKHYLEMEKDLFTHIEDFDVEVFHPAAKGNKCLQIGSGAMIVDDTGKWVPVHDEKLDALESIVTEMNGAPLLVAYQFVSERERILKRFKQAVALDNKPSTVHRFQRGEIPMLVVHPASAGHGLDLQHNCWAMVDFSSGWNLEYDEQVIERIGPTRQAQIGRTDRAVLRYRIVARDTLEDNVVLPVVQRKADVQDALKNAMKNRR